MSKIIISFALIIIAVLMRNFLLRKAFRKNPVGMRCWWYDLNRTRHRGIVEGRTHKQNTYMVFADDGNMWTVNNPKPLYFEL